MAGFHKLFFLAYNTLVLPKLLQIIWRTPNLINDLVLAKEVLPLFLQELGLYNVLTIGSVGLLVIGLLLSLFFLIRLSLRILEKVAVKHMVITAISLLFITLIFHAGIKLTFNKDKDHPTWKTLSWAMPIFVDGLSNDDTLEIGKIANNYSNLFDSPISTTPNIYLLFVESYGSVVQLLKEEGPLYDTLMMGLEKKLLSNNWHIASNYSIPPVIGGRSWLSFTSALTGLNIKNHLYFNEMLTNHYNYPHLIRFLNHKGYQTYRMKTMSNQKQSTKISYALTERFYAFDKWVKFDDIAYKGYQFDLLGGIPDQYALNYFDEHLRDHSAEPFFFFSINMTSHAPWYPPPPFVAHWQSLDSMTSAPPGHQKRLDLIDESMRYYQTIAYVLNSMVDFVINKVDENAIVLLVGDHQPPGMTFLCEGIINEYAVPIHIISKNKQYIDPLMKQSFTNSLHLDPSRSVEMKHQEIYDLILSLLQE